MLSSSFGSVKHLLANNLAEKAYEAYAFGLCLRAVRELNSTPIFCSINNTVMPPGSFLFREGPGQIHSTYRDYGYVSFLLGQSKFEIHVNVEFQGTSGMTHEVDVAIIRGLDADRCRSTPCDPTAASLVAGWECKFYTKNLDKHLGRAFVGLVDDLGTNLRESGICSNQHSEALRLFFKPQRRPYPHFFLSPLNSSNEDVFVNRLKGELKKLVGV